MTTASADRADLRQPRALVRAELQDGLLVLDVGGVLDAAPLAVGDQICVFDDLAEQVAVGARR